MFTASHDEAGSPSALRPDGTAVARIVHPAGLPAPVVEFLAFLTPDEVRAALAALDAGSDHA